MSILSKSETGKHGSQPQLITTNAMTDKQMPSIDDEVPFDGGTDLLENFLEASRGGSSEEPGNYSKYRYFIHNKALVTGNSR